jgi:hypothetical protein
VILNPCCKLNFLCSRYRDSNEEEKVANINVQLENMSRSILVKLLDLATEKILLDVIKKCLVMIAAV